MQVLTIQTRQLGRHLRELRKGSGVSVVRAAEELEISDATIYRVEAGMTAPKVVYVRALCDLYRADDRTREALVALAQEADTPGWWRSHNGAIPKWFELFVDMESYATTIRAYDAEVVPGLLQTRAYAEATFEVSRPRIKDSELEEQVAVRMQRQQLLYQRKPPQVEVVLSETALTRGHDRVIMAAQLRQLEEVSRLPNVTIRVVPSGVMHCALSAGARFYILTFQQPSEPTLVFVESLTGALYLDKPAEVEAYDEVWEGLTRVALTPGDSRNKVQEYMEVES